MKKLASNLRESARFNQQVSDSGDSKSHVLTQFGISPEAVEMLEVSQQKHPHIIDGVLVDLINGIEVIADHVKVSKSRNFPSRILDSVLGKSKERQDIINQNVLCGLEATSNWLQRHEGDFLEIRLSLSQTLGNVIKNRDAIKVLQQRSNSQDVKVGRMIGVLNEIILSAHDTNNRIDELNYRDKAQSHLQSEIDRWESGRNIYPGEFVQLYNLLDNLLHGDFGFYLNYRKSEPIEKERLKANLLDKCRILLSNRLGIETGAVLNSEHCWSMDEISRECGLLSNREKESLSYLSMWSSADTPMTHLLHSLVANSNVVHKRSVVVISRVVDRMVNEHFSFCESN